MMTSLMINLDSEAQFFTEIEEYTGDTVILHALVFIQVALKPKIIFSYFLILEELLV